MKKFGIIILAVGNLSYWDYTIPSIIEYARKIGCSYHIIRKRYFSDFISPHFEKFQIVNLLRNYKHLLYVDADVMIQEKAPDIRESLIETCNIYGVDDRVCFDCQYNNFKYSCNGWGEHDYPILESKFGRIERGNGYLNTGVLYLKDDCYDVLKYCIRNTPLVNSLRKRFLDPGEQTFWNYSLRKMKVKIGFLNHSWNTAISEYSKRNITSNSFFVHFMGDTSGSNGKLQKIKYLYPKRSSNSFWRIK